MRFPSFKIAVMAAVMACYAQMPPVVPAQEIEPDPALGGLKPLQGQVLQGQMRDQRQEDAAKPVTLQASVQTLEAAIQSERDIVDWYAWYLSAREYIARRGGISCPAGTMLKFPKKGFVQVQLSPGDSLGTLSGQASGNTMDVRCFLSVQGMVFPLPSNTRLEALLLPVRSSALPPAPPSEIYQRTKGFQ